MTSLTFYGLSLGVALLPGSLYVTSFISGAVEFPSYALSCVLLNKVGRKWPLVAIFVIGGVFCVLCGALLDNECKYRLIPKAQVDIQMTYILLHMQC